MRTNQWGSFHLFEERLNLSTTVLFSVCRVLARKKMEVYVSVLYWNGIRISVLLFSFRLNFCVFYSDVVYLFLLMLCFVC